MCGGQVCLNILHGTCPSTNVTPRPSTFVGLRPSIPTLGISYDLGSLAQERWIHFNRRFRMLCPPDFSCLVGGICWNMDKHGFYHLLYIYRISSCTARAITNHFSQKSIEIRDLIRFVFCRLFAICVCVALVFLVWISEKKNLSMSLQL